MLNVAVLHQKILTSFYSHSTTVEELVFKDIHAVCAHVNM